MNFIFSSWTLKDKIHVHVRACNMLYIFCFLEIHVNNVLLLVIQEVPCYWVKSWCLYIKELDRGHSKNIVFVNAIWKPCTLRLATLKCRFSLWSSTPKKPTIWASLHNFEQYLAARPSFPDVIPSERFSTSFPGSSLYLEKGYFLEVERGPWERGWEILS